MNYPIESDGKTTQVFRGQNLTNQHSNNSQDKGNSGALCGESEFVAFGLSGSLSEGQTIAKLLIFTGGILSRLESQIEERRSEAVECVQWYEREIEKCDHELEELKKLRDGLSE